MKRFGIGLGISGLLLSVVACSDDPVTSGNGGTAGTPAAGASSGGAGSGGMAGATTTAGQPAAGGGAGGAGGVATGGGGAGGGTAGGGAGGVATGGGGAGGGGSCVTTLGKALQFDGSKVDILSANLGADLPGGNTNRTIELWAKFTGKNSWTAEGSFLETGKHVTAGNQILGLDMSGRDPGNANVGRFGPYTNGFSDNNGDNGVKYTAPENAGWLHIAWSFDTEKGLSFTINGDSYPVQMGGQKLTLDLTPGIVTLGASQNYGANGWYGVMDEVKIWKVSKTPAEIKANMKVVPKADTAGLVAYYRFNEGTGTDVADEAKAASHTLKACAAKGEICPEANAAAPTWVDSDVPGPFTCQ